MKPVKKDTFDVSNIIRGNKETFKRIYLKHYDGLFYLCVEYTQDTRIAEEIVQDTFLKLWEIRKEISHDTNIFNLLYTIAKNKCLNYLRDQKIILKAQKSRRFLEIQNNYEALAELDAHNVQFDELKEMINTAIENLPEDIRKTFLMSRYDNLKYKEIAQQLSISEKTVEARISKALQYLRDSLKEYL